jgi:hypothetical protein
MSDRKVCTFSLVTKTDLLAIERQYLGPAEFSSGNMRQFLLAIRLHLILGALTTRQSTFLASKEWLDVTSDNDDDGELGKLLDILAQLPALRSDFVRMRQMLDSSAQLCAASTALEKLWNLRAAMYLWSLSISSNAQEAMKRGRPIPPGDKRGHSPYTFACFRDTVMIMLYWACLTEVYNLLGQTYEVVGMFRANAFAPQSLEGLLSVDLQSGLCEQQVQPFAAASRCRNSAMLHATSICSAATSFTFNTGDAFRWVYLIFPLKVASRCFLLNLPGALTEFESIHETLQMLENSGAYILQSLGEDHSAY